MQKVLTISLSGIAFQIEENAYQILNDYFAKIKNYYQSKSDGLKTVMDIEQEMAKMLAEKNTLNATNIIQLDIVNGCIRTLELHFKIKFENNELNTNINKSNTKHFFRDTQNRIVGGVCTGLGAYTGIPYWMIRAVFLLTFFIGGFGIIAYLILWIAVPKAKNNADRMAMASEPASMANMVDAIIEKTEEIKSGKMSGLIQPFWGFIKFAFGAIFRVSRKFIGLFLLLFAFLFAFFLLISIGFSNSSFTLNNNIFDTQALLSLLYKDIENLKIWYYALFFSLSIPVLYLFFVGFWLINSRFIRDKILHLGLVSIWFLSFFLVVFYCFKLTNEFSKTATNTQNLTVMAANNVAFKIEPYESEQNIGNRKITTSFFGNQYILADSGLYISNLELIIEPTLGTNVNLIYEASANGSDIETAQNNIKNITYRFSMLDNRLLLDDYIKIKKGELWRNQKVKIRLLIPDNQLFMLDDFITRFDLNINSVLPENSNLQTNEWINKMLYLENGKLKIFLTENKENL